MTNTIEQDQQVRAHLVMLIGRASSAVPAGAPKGAQTARARDSQRPRAERAVDQRDLVQRDLGQRHVGQRIGQERHVGERNVGQRDVGQRDVGQRDVGATACGPTGSGATTASGTDAALTGDAAVPGDMLRSNPYLRQLLQYMYSCAMPPTTYDTFWIRTTGRSPARRATPLRLRVRMLVRQARASFRSAAPSASASTPTETSWGESGTL